MITILTLYPNNPPTLKRSFVCHADILGFSQLSAQEIARNEGNAFLRRLRTALNRGYSRIKTQKRAFHNSDFFEIKVFTDNIVVGYPVAEYGFSYGESELDHIFDIFSEFQLGLAMEGFLVRGGVALGMLYMDDDIVFGDALIEAVAQDKSGGAPKISLAPSATLAVQHHLGFYAHPEHAPQTHSLLQDSDGSIFINYLQNAFIAFPEGGIFFEAFEKHKSTLMNGLIRNRDTPAVWSKYEWASRYHNVVIDDFLASHPLPSNLDCDEIYATAVSEAQRLSEYRIDVESMAARPSKLVLAPIQPSA